MTIVPLTGPNVSNRMWIDGSDLAHARVVSRSMIGTGYFHAMKTPMVAGRELEEHDISSFAKVAVVNEEFAKELFGGSNALGKRFWIETTSVEPQMALEVVGIVKDSKYRYLREETLPLAFTPLSKDALERPGARFMIRSAMRPDASISSIRGVLVGISPNLRYTFNVLDTWIGQSLVRERLITALSGVFGALALLLTTVGLYGVISYTVARRTNEIGIRIALGAGRASVIGLVLRETGLILVAGLAGGTLLALAVGRASASLLYGLKSDNPLALITGGAVLTIVAVAASYLPAARAARVNPVVALREE
jgi:ABC-type antimicrobial peptide transport system permease subunit